jgi:hypothetical protein
MGYFQSFISLPVGILQSLLHSTSTENREIPHHRVFCDGQTIRNRPENFEKVRQYMIRRVHVCIDLSGGHNGHLL